MYLNFTTLNSNLSLDHPLFILIALKQNDFSKFTFSESVIQQTADLELIKRISEKYKWKLSDKGKKLLRDLQIANITDESVSLAKDVSELYYDHGLENMIGSNKELLKRVSWFLAESGFNPLEIRQN